MFEYRLVDGPLKGAILATPTAERVGALVNVDRVDVMEHPDDLTAFTYVVTAPPGRWRAGRLRHREG